METTQNHYSVLNLTKSATTIQIKQSYRSLALQFHPDKNYTPEARERFNEITEAYGVLNDATKRQEYDRSRNFAGVFNAPFFQKMPDFSSPSRMEEAFNSWFEDGNDFFDGIMKDIDNNVSNCNIGQKNSSVSTIHDKMMEEGEFLIKKSMRKDPPVEKDLYLSLEEINTGVTKKLQITRKIFLGDGIYSRQEDKVLIINVMPGWKAGTKVTFVEEGDRKPDVLPADVIFTIKDKIHKDFSRDSDNNLIYFCRLSLKVALIGGCIDIPTLNGTTLRINHGQIIRPGLSQVIVGEGLPLSTNPTRRANLIIQYQIIFPQDLSSEQKQVICDSLPSI